MGGKSVAESFIEAFRFLLGLFLTSGLRGLMLILIFAV